MQDEDNDAVPDLIPIEAESDDEANADRSADELIATTMRINRHRRIKTNKNKKYSLRAHVHEPVITRVSVHPT